jgi:hypothetical protein
MMYTKYLQKHVRPFVGSLKAEAVDIEVVDSFYAELRRHHATLVGWGQLRSVAGDRLRHDGGVLAHAEQR